MSFRARVLLVAVSVVALLTASLPPAQADDINPTEEEWAAYLEQGDLSDSPHGWSSAYTEVVSEEEGQRGGINDDPWGGQATCVQPEYEPYEEDLWYKEFTPIGGGNARKIRVDVYKPTVGEGPWPGLVLVHGGGWWKGCRRQISREAMRWSNPEHEDFIGEAHVSQKFIVFAIDYRLSCESNTDPQIGPLCGWTYQTIDSDTSEGGAAIDDVRDAVEWVRNTWAEFPGHEGFLDDDKVAIAGSSAGGTLGYHAAATATGDFRPDAVAGWSGALEFRTSINPDWGEDPPHGCDEGQSNNPTACWTATNRYLECGPPPDEPDDTCDEPDGTYETASPYVFYEDDGPPVFFANGGGGEVDPEPELIGILEIHDFQLYLDEIINFVGDFQMCEVETDLHATGLLSQTCLGMGPGYTVRQRTNFFLADQLGL